MKELFCDYTTALRLKNLGFDESCIAYYKVTHFTDFQVETLLSEFVLDYSRTVSYTQADSVVEVSAPLYQQALAWLDSKGHFVEIQKTDGKYYINYKEYYYKYSQAVEDKRCLIRLSPTDILLNPSYFYKGSSSDLAKRISDFYSEYDKKRPFSNFLTDSPLQENELVSNSTGVGI